MFHLHFLRRTDRGSFRPSKVAAGLTAAIVVLGGGLLTASAQGSASGSSLVPITPCRLLDTRAGQDNVGQRDTPMGSGETYVTSVWNENGQCNIPTTATAVSMNVTFVNPSAASFLTVFPADATTRPSTSNLNWVTAQAPTPNAVTSRLSADGDLAFYNLAGSVDVIADIVGYYEPTGSSGAGPAGPKGDPGQTGATGATGTSGAQHGRQVVGVSVLATATPTDFEAVTLGVDGNPVIAYYEGPTQDLRVIKCADPACSSGNESSSTVDSVDAVGLDTSITLGADGNPVIAYRSYTNSDLKVAKCNDPACAGSNETITIIDSAGDVGEMNSIAIGTDGNPVISYWDYTNNDVKVAKCNDPACTGGDETITTIDSAGKVGFATAITIGTDGDPVVSYWDVTSGDLKVAKCNDAACAGGDETITAVDTAGEVGDFSSITIGTDGNPVIAYADVTNAVLKVASCNDPACVGGDETITTPGGAVAGASHISITVGANGNPIVSYFGFHLYQLWLLECNDPKCSGSDDTAVAIASAGDDATSITVGANGNPIVAFRDRQTGQAAVAAIAHSSWAVNSWGR